MMDVILFRTQLNANILLYFNHGDEVTDTINKPLSTEKSSLMTVILQHNIKCSL